MQDSRWLDWIIGRRPGWTLLRAAAWALAAFILCTQVARPLRVRGVSMEPTLVDRSIHVGNLLRYRRAQPQRGDIVLIAMSGHKAYYVKRVLAGPSERVMLSDGRLYINGVETPEPYLPHAGDWSMPEREMGADEFFVAGDNRRVALADHLAGAVHRDRIAGGLFF